MTCPVTKFLLVAEIHNNISIHALCCLHVWRVGRGGDSKSGLQPFSTGNGHESLHCQHSIRESNLQRAAHTLKKRNDTNIISMVSIARQCTFA